MAMDFFTSIEFPDLVLLILAMLLLGGCAGFLAGLLGVGGGIILVPGLYMIFAKMQPILGFEAGHMMHTAVGTSLAIIIPTGLSSAYAHRRKDAIDFKLVFDLGIGVLIGVFVTTGIVNDISGDSLKMIFAAMLLVLAGIMLANPSRWHLHRNIPSQPFVGGAGVIIGALSSLIGIGGASLSVPYMTLHNVPMHRAVGTASALGIVISLPAAAGFICAGIGENNLLPYSIGYINVLAWLCIIPSSTLLAPMGAKVAHGVSVTRLRRFFAIFMILVSLNMWRTIVT